MNTPNSYVNMYASDGSIYNGGNIYTRGVLSPFRTCGVATLGAGGSVTVTTLDVTQPVVLISRKTTNGGDGFLRYSITGTQLTISSTNTNDRGEVSWLLVSNYDND